MTLYQLYLESGPMHKKTMVHVLNLLGCIAKGPTTDEALSRTPAAIRAYLRFLQRHGAVVDPGAEVQTTVVEHVTQGQWLGNGDPALVFQPDLEPLTPADAEQYIQRLEWSRAELLALVGTLTSKQLEAEPGPKQRSIRAMLEHILESEHFYLSALGKIEGMPGSGMIIQQQEGALLEWMHHVRAREVARIRSLTLQERSQPIIRWKQTWTARKTLRRMLEHEWEHLVELHERLAHPHFV